MATITIEGVCKTYGDVVVLENIHLEMEEGEFVVLVGPSGCGKSTLLRMIAGLERAGKGDIRFDGHSVMDMPPQQRNLAMVFQTYALYPHMNVRENIAYGLKVHKFPKDEIDRRIQQAVEMLQLQDYLERRPVQLSGGQRQRVAMARAMVREPVAFLYDEPLSNLDAYLRVAMREEIKNLHRRLGKTSLYVTHDQVEAMTMGDRIVVMKDGLIRQIGTPMALYDTPDDVFVAQFIGSPPMNILDIIVAADGFLLDDGSMIKVPRSLIDALGEGRNVQVGLRPEQLQLDGQHNSPQSGETTLLHMRATVKSRDDLGQDSFLRVMIGNTLCLLRTHRHVKTETGHPISLMLDIAHAHFFHGIGEKHAGKRILKGKSHV